MKYKNLIIFLILILASLLRIYKVNVYPPLLWDEASLGYNAYSLLKTGKDEFGTILPLTLKSFGDYKPALYAYIDIPFVAIFGLTQFAVRLPSVLAGILTVYLIYLVIDLYTKNTKLALLASFLLATNPFHILLSRGAWETNLVSTFFLAAIYFLQNKKYLFSIIFFVLPAYTYQSAKLTAPLLFLTTLLIYPKVKTVYKLAIFFCLFSPLIFLNFFGKDSNRFKTMTILSYTQPDISKTSIFFPQLWFMTKNVLIRYFNHFSPQLLFTQGDWQNPRQSAPYTGILLLITLPFLIIGLFSSKPNKLHQLLLIWLFLAPIPSSLTKDIVQPVRATSFIIPLVFFTAVGIEKILKHKFLLSLFIIVLVINLAYVQEMYYQHMVKKSPQEWLFGYQEAIQFALNKQSEQTFFTNFYGQPHIYYAFVSKMDPVYYQSQIKLTTTSNDVGTVDKLNSWEFKDINFNQYKDYKNITLVMSRDELLRQNLDFAMFTPLGSTDINYANFYGYKK